MIACEKGNNDAINVLLNAGVDSNIADTDGNTWLHYAARNNCCAKVLQSIKNHGIDVNITNKKNATALMLACEKGNLNKDTINVFCNAGADMNIPDIYGDTYLHYASRNDCCSDVLWIIISHGGDVNATNKHNVTALMLACEKGNRDAINVLLGAGADTNIKDWKGATCIQNAVAGGCSKDMLETIVSHGADVNVTNNNDVTALMTACRNGNKDATNVFLNAGADPNVADANGETCLHYAAQNDSCTEDLQAIISHGVDVNAKDKNNVTALMIASLKGNLDAINILLNAEADASICNAESDTCLHYATFGDCSSEVLQAIICHAADVNAANKYSQTPLQIACQEGAEDAIIVLLNAGADPNFAGPNGDTCLHYVARKFSSPEVLKAIISHGVDVYATDKDNRTALMIACMKGNINAINVLLNAGADLKIADAGANTCLHYAVKNNCCTEVLQAIISHGVVVNAICKDNRTALMIACEEGNKDVINVLLTAGADPNIADADGETCLHCAVLYDLCTDVLQAIISLVGDVNATNKRNETALMIACQNRNNNGINVLLNGGADPNLADRNGDTCLHYALQDDYCTEVLQAVISNGGDVNAAGKDNRTGLMIACMKANNNVINVLLNAGADPNIADGDGDTCLHYAAQNDCCTEVLQAIISHGIDVNATNKKHVTALIIACHKANADAINILLEAGADPNITDSKGANMHPPCSW